MELEDLKNDWEQLQKYPQKSTVTGDVLDKITKKKVQNRILRIVIPELTGSIVCLGGSLFIGLNFYRLTAHLFEVAGALSILFLLLVPLVSWLSIEQLYKTGNIDKPYAETIKDFAAQKIRFCRFQKFNIILVHLLLVSLIITSARVFGTNAITESKHYYPMALTLGYAFLSLFSAVVRKKYNKTIQQADKLIREVNS